MRRFRPLTRFSVASVLALLTAGIVTTSPPLLTASASPGDRWLEVQPMCCGGDRAAVGLAGAWPSGLDAVLEIDRVPLGDVDLTMTQTTPTIFFIGSTLGVGDVVRVTVDGVTKDLVVEPLSIEWILSDTDEVHGLAPDGRTVEVTANPGPEGRTLTVVATGGAWTVDFTGVFDIQEQDPSSPAPPAAQVSARIVEAGPLADGDALGAGRTANTPVINVYPNCCGDQAIVQTGGWRSGTLVTLDVLRGTTTLLHKTVTFTGFPQLTDTGELAVLQIGDVVRVSAFGLTKEVTVVPLTITSVDAATDTVTGTAPAGATGDVTVIVPNVPGPSPAIAVLTANGSGQWTASFAPFDLLPTHQVNARVIDPERDSVAMLFFPPPPDLMVVTPDTDLVDGQQVQLTATGWPVNSTLYVTQCRTDMGLSPDACAPATQMIYTLQPDGTLPAGSTFPVARQLATGSGSVDCGVTQCGLVGVVWPGEPMVGYPIALDDPSNNPIQFASEFDFAGFFSPVDNPPVRNTVKAGSAVPVRFSLGGDQGLDILAAGYPTSRAIACDMQAPSDAIESTIAVAGKSVLTYDARTDRYQFEWKTSKEWRGCRQLTVKLSDGTTHVAIFDFR